LRDIKNACAVEVLSSYLQPASHGFLDCLVILTVVTCQVTFQGPEQMVVIARRDAEQKAIAFDSISSKQLC
jgi:hypothetical protein